MTEILNDLSNKRAVIRAIEDNMASFWMKYGEAEGGEAVTDKGLLYFTTGLPHPLFNAVFAAELTLNEIEPTIAHIMEHYAARKLPFFWWTGPQTVPSDLGEHLKRHGFHSGGYMPGMAVELSTLPDYIPLPDDFVVEKVKDTSALQQWVDVLATSNEMDPALRQRQYEMAVKLGLDKQRYLGILGGEPVAASESYLADGVVGIYAVATLPEARGKGIGAAMTLQPLLDARKSGFKVGVLQSSPMGHNVYKRLGFKDFCELEIYMYLPK